MAIFRVLKEQIDVTTLNWEVIQHFSHRTYYLTQDLNLWIMRVLAFTERENERNIGTRLVYPGRSITIDCTANIPEILIPVEQTSPLKYWLPGTIDEAFWLSNRLGIPISVDSESVDASFAVNCVYNQHLEQIRQSKQ